MKKTIVQFKKNQRRVLSECLREPHCDLEELHVHKALPKQGEWLYIYKERG